MGKIVSLLIALSVAITIIVPDINIKAYFVNLLQNFPELLPVFKNSVVAWNNALELFRNGVDFADFLEGLKQIFIFLGEFLVIAPTKLLYWLIQAMIVIFGGAIQ